MIAPMPRMMFILLGFAALASPLSAQHDEEPSFESLMEDGLRLREAGQDAEALALFEKCFELRPESGQAVGQIAFAEMALGRLVLAEAHLVAALRIDDDPWVGRHSAALEEAQVSLNTQIATVVIPVEGGEVTFTESGQRRTRRTPVTLRLSPGRHELRVTSPGFEPTLSTLTIEAGQSLTHIPPRRPSVATTTMEPIVSARPTETHGPLLGGPDPARYLVRSIRLDVSAALFASGAIGTGIAAWAAAPSADYGYGNTRSTTNRVLIGTAIGTGALALALFMGARITRMKHRRENTMPTF